jgi:hypothetical protein
MKIPAKYNRDESSRAGYTFGATHPRPLATIAREIRRDWKNVYFGAVPYLEALAAMDKVTDTYGADSGESIVLYFLSNATTWRGGVARHIKAELQAMVDQAKGER